MTPSFRVPKGAPEWLKKALRHLSAKHASRMRWSKRPLRQIEYDDWLVYSKESAGAKTPQESFAVLVRAYERSFTHCNLFYDAITKKNIHSGSPE